MRELTLDELTYVAGGLQDSSYQETVPESDGGGSGTAGAGSAGSAGNSGASPPPITDSAPPPRLVLQAFFDDMGDAVATGNGGYSGSDYEHDMGADYSPNDFYDFSGIPSHDPSIGVPYWNPDYGVDPEFIQYLTESTPSHIVSGTISSPGSSLDNIVALKGVDQGHVAAYVNGIFYDGTYHSGSVNNNDYLGNNSEEIVVTGNINGGYWIFTATSPVAPPLFDLPTGQSPSGSGATGVTTPTPLALPNEWRHLLDSNVDTAAAALAQKIQAKPNFSTTEYSAYIWIDPQNIIHTTNIVEGNHYNTGENTFNPSYYGVPSGAAIIGFIHNHPETYIVQPEYASTLGVPAGAAVYNFNSQFTDVGDMNGMNYMATSNRSYSAYVDNGINYFRNYIVHGSNTDEYDFVQYPNLISGPPTNELPSLQKSTFSPVLPIPTA